MNKYLVATFAALAISVSSFNLEYKFEDDKEIIQNTTESPIISAENVTFVQVIPNEEMSNTYTLKIKEKAIEEHTSYPLEDAVITEIVEIPKQDKKPDYHNIEKVPITEW